jgi:aminopeptidase
MPDGEVFYSPVEDTAEGVITYAEFPAVYLGHDVVGARLVFREGKVVEASADEGEEFLKQILATDEGASRLGELGLGCNPRITQFTRNVLFDEKIAGTVHLAVGASYTYTGRQERERRPLGHGQGPCVPAERSRSTASSSSGMEPG